MMNALLNQIVCVWLLFVLHGIIVGLVQVEIQQTSKVSEDVDQNKEQTNSQNVVSDIIKSQISLWPGTLSEKLYMRRNANVTLEEHSNRAADAVNTVRITRGLRVIFQENQIYYQLVPITYFLLFIYVQLYFLVHVGDKIKRCLENLMARTTPQRCANQALRKLKSMVMLLSFLIMGLILCIPLRNRYISRLADQEDKLIKQISREVKQNNTFYLSTKVDLALVFYYSILNCGFLLSVSYCFATVVDLMRLAAKQMTITHDNHDEPKIGPDDMNV